MVKGWKSIAPPGGCDQCHSQPISANWSVSYRAANVADGRGRLPFQTPEYNDPTNKRQSSETKPETLKTESMRCFDCHKTPVTTHKDWKGLFHH